MSFVRRVNISNWNTTCVELSRDQSQILLLVPHKHKLMLSKRPGSIIQHSENLEQKIYKLLGWQDWSSWDSCSKSCNGGIQERTRRCSAGRICEGRGCEGRVCKIILILISNPFVMPSSISVSEFHLYGT